MCGRPLELEELAVVAMTLVERRIKGIPITFMAVLLVTFMLTIFFGAWAVSADASAQNREFSFGIASGPNYAAVSSGTSAETDEPGGAVLANESVADTWWGRSLLKACPLH